MTSPVPFGFFFSCINPYCYTFWTIISSEIILSISEVQEQFYRGSWYEALTSHSLKAVYDVDVIQGTFQRFAMFINRLPVDLQIKAIRLLVERIIIFKDHVIVKVFESPVEDIQKALDEKFVFWGVLLTRTTGAKNEL